MPSLIPYRGIRKQEHLGPDGGGGHQRQRYGVDTSGQVTYAFNSAGFRSEELLDSAMLRVFVCGCSVAMGTGLNIEDSWPHKLKLGIADFRNIGPDKVNLLNFSQGGASNDYITRTTIEQTSVVRPDLVVALFTLKERFELYDDAHCFHLQSYLFEQYAQSPFPEVGRQGEFMLLATNEVFEAFRTIRNILMLQCFCQARRIPFLFSFVGMLEKPLRSIVDGLRFPITEAHLEAIDFDACVRLDPDMFVDRAADNVHPGGRSQVLIANAFLEHLPRALKTTHA